jgi:hypothetical protein
VIESKAAFYIAQSSVQMTKERFRLRTIVDVKKSGEKEDKRKI